MTPFVVQRDIPYEPLACSSRVGDLFLPGKVSGPPVLLIHGGGWKGLSKEDFEFMAGFFLGAGHPVFNINYRLIGVAPWPACGDDCVTAGEFLIRGGLAPLGLPAVKKILICGASAGGHLAMMTGLRLPRKNVAAILSMAGPSRIDWVATNRDPLGLHVNFISEFYGRAVSLDAAEIREASPALRSEKLPPPLFCLHSRNDRLVPVCQSEEALAVWQADGGEAELTTFDGDGNLHGFWIEDLRDESHLRPEVGEFVGNVLKKLS